MRRLYVILGGLLAFSLLAFGLNLFWTLILLLFETGQQDLIPSTELHALLDAGPQSDAVAQQLIPSIIHQTYKNSSVPDKWEEPWGQCQEMNRNYTYYVSITSNVTSSLIFF